MLKLVLKDAGTELELTEGRHTIGRDPGNDLVLDDDSVSGFHAQIIVEGDAAGLIDLGSTNGVTVDGQPAAGRIKLKAWQKVCFGSIEAEVIDPAGRRPTSVMRSIRDEDLGQAGTADQHRSTPKPADGPVRGHLKRQSHGDYPAEAEIRSRLEIGREAGADLQLASDMISSRHARIDWKDGQLVVTDLGSTNGTWVNGERIRSQKLSSGDRVAFDEIEYRFVSAGEPERKATTVNPAIGGGRSGTTVRSAVDAPSTPRRDTPPSKPSVPASRNSETGDATASRNAAQDKDQTRPSPRVDSPAPDKPPADTATRVQPAVQRPVRRQQATSPSASARRDTPPQNHPALGQTSAPAAEPTPARQSEAPVQKKQKKEKPQPQQIVVKQKGSGCMIAMMFFILLIVGFPVLVFIFKVGFLIAIFNEIKSFFGL